MFRGRRVAKRRRSRHTRRMLRDGLRLRHHGREVLTEDEGAAHAAPGEHAGQPAARVVPHLVERHRVEREPLGIEFVGCPGSPSHVRQTNTLRLLAPRLAVREVVASAARAARGRTPRTTTPDSSNTSRTAASVADSPGSSLPPSPTKLPMPRPCFLRPSSTSVTPAALAQEVADADLGQRHRVSRRGSWPRRSATAARG